MEDDGNYDEDDDRVDVMMTMYYDEDVDNQNNCMIVLMGWCDNVFVLTGEAFFKVC